MFSLNCAYLEPLRQSVADLARLAFAEDLPNGDVTATVLAMSDRQGDARIICREPIFFCGAAWFDVLLDSYRAFAPNALLELTCHAVDGQALAAGSTLFTLVGDTAAIVGLERVLLNFLGRGIGIANATAAYVAEVRRHSTITQVLDTRKTLPGYRYFDKYAVLCGGGQNHRMNLSDMVLIKENHLAKLGGVQPALAYVRAHLDRVVPIQVEVCDLDQLDQALAAQCPLIMLDNFKPELVAQAMTRNLGTSQIEVSGGVTLATIGEYARFSPHRISIGAITHSVKAPDLSLLIQTQE